MHLYWSNNEDEEDENCTNAFLNFLGDLCGKVVATRWDAWFEKNVKGNIIVIDISSDHVAQDQCGMRGKKRKDVEFNTTPLPKKKRSH